MDASLGGKGRGANIGCLAERSTVKAVVEGARNAGDVGEPGPGDSCLESVGELSLQQQRRDEGDQVGVAAAFANAVERALDLAHAGADRRQRISHRLPGIVMGVDAELGPRRDL